MVAFALAGLGLTNSDVVSSEAGHPGRDQVNDLWEIGWRYLPGLGVLMGSRSTLESLSDKGAATGGNPLLSLDSAEGVVLGLQVRDDFDSTQRDPLPGTFSWTDDIKSEGQSSEFTIDLAVIATLYLTDGWLFGYNPELAANRIRFGVDLDRHDTESGREDIVRYRADAQFLLGQKLHSLFDFDKSFRPADVWTVGAEYRQDLNDDTEAWAFDVSYNPVVSLLPFFADEASGWLFLGRRSYLGEAPSSEVTNIRSKGRLDPFRMPPVHVNVAPVFTLETADTSSLSGRGFDDTTYFAKVAWNNTLSLFNERLKLAYQVVGHQPLNGPSDFFFHQTASIEWNPDPNLPLSVTINYKDGENSPNFEDEEIVSISLGLSF